MLKRGTKKATTGGAEAGDTEEAKMLAALDGGAEVVLSDGGPEPSDNGEWLSPEEDMELERAVIDRVMMIPGQKDGEKPRPAYVYRLPDQPDAAHPNGQLFMISERAFMKTQRFLNIGAVVSIKFTSKADGDFGAWRGRIVAHSRGKGPMIYTVLRQEWRKLSSGVLRDFAAPSEADEVPF